MANRIGARPLLGLAAGVALAGCMNFSSLDDLELVQPPANPFAQALFKNYSFLARSFGDVGEAGYTSFDEDGSIPLTETDATVASLANTYAQKAVVLSKGEIVDPEPSRDIKTHDLRDRLVRALTPGRDNFPRDAARAQADWDCWRLNLTASGQAAAAEQCRRSFNVTLPRLEAETTALAKAAEKAEAKPGDKPAAPAATPAPDTRETP
jgi:hypothetical protein